MNLPKAKEILDLNAKEAGKKMPLDTLIAVQIGSAAIARLLVARSYGDPHTLQRLPGED